MITDLCPSATTRIACDPRCGGRVEEDATTVDHDLLKVVEVVDESVRGCLANEWPELLGGVEAPGEYAGRNKVDADRPLNVFALVPARSVEDEDDAPVLSGPDGFCEVSERDVEGRDVHCWQQQPLDRSCRRTNEAVEVEPLVAEVLPDERALAALSPDAPRRWLQSDTSFVLRPDFDSRFGDDERAVGGAWREARGAHEHGMTPLLAQVTEQDGLPPMRALLDAGADVDACDDAGSTADDFARSRDQREKLALLAEVRRR